MPIIFHLGQAVRIPGIEPYSQTQFCFRLIHRRQSLPPEGVIIAAFPIARRRRLQTHPGKPSPRGMGIRGTSAEGMNTSLSSSSGG